MPCCLIGPFALILQAYLLDDRKISTQFYFSEEILFFL